MVELDDVARYLDNVNTEHSASLVLGEVADRLASMGFVATLEQMALPAEAYTQENQLGVENQE